MIIDSLDNINFYTSLHPRIEEAITHLKDKTISNFPIGKMVIDSERLYINIDQATGKTPESARLEAHKHYIDIQIPIEHPETIGWKPITSCKAIETPYDPERDICFFSDLPDTFLYIPLGCFAIFFPQDTHAPCITDVAYFRKAVVKIRID